MCVLCLVHRKRDAEREGIFNSDHLSLITKDQELPPIEHANMLVLFYFPELHGDYIIFMQAFDDAREWVHSTSNAYESGLEVREKSERGVEVSMSWNKFLYADRAIKERIIKLVKNYS